MSKKKVLRKFTVLCWAAFIAILGCMQPVSHGLDTPRHPDLKVSYRTILHQIIIINAVYFY